MEWEKVLRNSVKDGRISENHIKKIPVLKNCDNWKLVEPIGYLEYKGKYANYKGMLVMLKDRIYFVTDKTIDALSEFVHWKIKGRIEVIPDKK